MYERTASWSQIREQILASKNGSDDVMLRLVSIFRARAYRVGQLFVNFLTFWNISVKRNLYRSGKSCQLQSSPVSC